MHDELSRLLVAREGHFRLESGHHTNRWFDLDLLFVEPARVQPLAQALASRLAAHRIEAVCGPLVGGAFLAQMVAATLGVAFQYTERVLPADGDGMYRASYRLPAGLRERVRDRAVAIVDDVISAGSAVGGTYAELLACHARPVVVGALLTLGTAGRQFFAERHVPVESLAQLPFELWLPDACPRCAAGESLEDPGAPASV